jgi:hypothetical protein
MCSSIRQLRHRGRLPPGGAARGRATDQATDCRIRSAFASGRAVRRDGVGPAVGGRDNRPPESLRNLVRAPDSAVVLFNHPNDALHAGLGAGFPTPPRRQRRFIERSECTCIMALSMTARCARSWRCHASVMNGSIDDRCSRGDHRNLEIEAITEVGGKRQKPSSIAPSETPA